jgi:hypothetical protein
MMDFENRWFYKEFRQDLTWSVRPLKSWDISHCEYEHENTRHHVVKFGAASHITNVKFLSLFSLNITINKCVLLCMTNYTLSNLN